jgi:hypothetical protein
MATVPIGLLQEADDLLFRKPLLDVQPPSSEGLDSKPICYSNAGGRRPLSKAAKKNAKYFTIYPKNALNCELNVSLMPNVELTGLRGFSRRSG